MEIKTYTDQCKAEWDNFVRTSKNGTFLFCRDFIEYHADRFNDHSLMFYDEGVLVAVLPGHLDGDTFCSHLGLTYGGFVFHPAIRMAQVVTLFDVLIDYLSASGMKKMIYKPVPHIYHKYPSEEDLYMLFIRKGTLVSRAIASTIAQENKLEFNRLRRRQISKANETGLRVCETESFAPFWSILTDNLNSRYKVKPVHTLAEITYLKERFASEIRLFCVFNDDEIIAGCVIFETDMVAHAQYSSATVYGKEVGAMDFLYDYLINTVFGHKKYFDYGISTENEGLYLNSNLIAQKEGFGARGIVYDTYRIDL